MTKTKRFSRIITFALAMLMVVAMAVPAFASGYRPNGAFGYMLNINGSGALKGRVCNLYQTDLIGPDQNFTIGTRTGYSGFYMYVTNSSSFAINRSTSGGRAIIWPLSTGHVDSQLYDNDQSVIRLMGTRELLTAREPIFNLSQVYFGGPGISVWIQL